MPYNYCSRTASKQPVVSVWFRPGALMERWKRGRFRKRYDQGWRTALAKTLSWIKEFVHDYTRQHEIYGLCAVKSSNQRQKEFDGSDRPWAMSRRDNAPKRQEDASLWQVHRVGLISLVLLWPLLFKLQTVSLSQRLSLNQYASTFYIKFFPSNFNGIT